LILEEIAMVCKNLVRYAVACLIAIFAATAASAAVRLPALIADNMVLQREQPLPIWGWATAGEEVTVSIAGQKLTTKAGDDGRWKVTLDKLDVVPVAAPLEMTIEGSSGTAIKLKNILVGEVWVCSGQSNMGMGIGAANNAKEEIAAAKYPQMRLFSVPLVKAIAPLGDVHGDWRACSPKTVAYGPWGGFSAAAYFFGRALHRELKVPVGLINTSWGGTPAEFWTSETALAAEPSLKPMSGKGDNSSLYNGMISPLIPFAIRGAIWYQGEANVGRAMQYRTLLPTMIRNWRTDWKQGDFPFGIVQIAPYRYNNGDATRCAELWEAQLLTAKHTPNTGLIVTTDIGNIADIHPKNKQEVGRRLALWALATAYGRKLEYSGPVYQSMSVKGDKAVLKFDRVCGGLVARDGKPLTDFNIAGEDKKFHPAVAEIAGDTIVVSSKEVPKPAAVRFAWRETAEPNLANKDGFPASPFGTDQEK